MVKFKNNNFENKMSMKMLLTLGWFLSGFGLLVVVVGEKGVEKLRGSKFSVKYQNYIKIN